MNKEIQGRKTAFLAVSIVALMAGCTLPAAAPVAPTSISLEKTASPDTAPSSKPAQKLERIKLQLPSKAAPLMNFGLGQEKGIFEQEAINLEQIVIKAALAPAALLAGEIDYSAMGTAMMESGLGGLPVKQILNMRSKVLLRLLAGQGINSAADLKGKVVAVTSIGSTAHFAIREAVRYLGLDPDKDVTFVGIPDANAIVALKAGSIAAAGLAPPFDIIAKDQGFKELVFTADIMDLTFNGVGTTDKRLKENPDQVKRMLRATLKSMAYMKDHQDEGRAFLVKDFGIEPRLAPTIYKDIVDTMSLNGSASDKALKASVDMSRAQGRIKGDVPIEKGIDFTLLKEVQREMNLAP